MAHLSLGVLGSLQVLIDDTPVTKFESDRAFALLTYLVVEAGRPHWRYDSIVAACRTRLGEAAFAEAWAEAATRPFQEVVEEVLKSG